MKRYVAFCLCLALLFVTLPLSPVYAERKGGYSPMFGSCCIGPRVGLEMNEGKSIQDIEWVRFIVNLVAGPLGSIISGFMQGSKNGAGGFFASCCIGPRVGEQLDHRRIRTMEWLYLIPVVSLVPWVVIGIDAYNGKTMTEIEMLEDLRK